MQERRRLWYVVRDWICCRVQASSHTLFVAPEWAANSIFCKGCKHWEHKKCSGLKRLTEDPDYKCTRCQGTVRPSDGTQQRELPSRVWQAGGGSFFLLPGRHALSSRWLWAVDHNTCENCLEGVQGADTSSLFPSTFSQDTWLCVKLLCAERNAPCQWNLGINKAQPPASAAKWQSNDQTDLQCKTTGLCQHQVHWATCTARRWRPGPHTEREKAPLVWTRGTLQGCSQDSLWHIDCWKAWAWEAQDDLEAADREGLQRVESLNYRPSW